MARLLNRVLIFSAMRFAPDGTLLLSPSDLANHLACAHLTQLELRVQRGELARPHVDDPYGQIILRKGNEHEAAYLARLEAEGLRVLRLQTYDDEGFDADEARRATEEAIRARRGGRHLPGLPHATAPGAGSRTSSCACPTARTSPSTRSSRARRSRSTCIQLCFYAEQLERIQGRLPEHVHVELGSGERETLRTADFIAFFRRSRRAAPGRDRRRRAGRARGRGRSTTARSATSATSAATSASTEDHPILVAGLGAAARRAARRRRDPDADGARRRRLPTTEVHRIRPETFERIRSQAALQLHFTRTGERRVELLPDEEERGFRTLPPPSEGDVWLDLEGHPFYEPARGLEYLFGWCYRDGRRDALRGRLGARPRRARRRAFERFVDWVEARRRVHPDLHVYHYAGYERTALRRLMGEHSTREREIDDWLRQELLVDLYRVVKQSLRAGVDELLDQGDREAVRVRAHGRGRGRRRVGRPLRAVARGAGRRAARGDPRLQRGGLPLDGRAPRVAPRAAAGRASLAAAA